VYDSKSIESLEKYHKLTVYNLLILLNNKYSDSILDKPPYHYIITDDEIVELKSTNLAHHDNGELSIYNNDIKILLMSDDLLKFKEDEIADLIADLSIKYSMKISDKIVYKKFAKNSSDTKQINNIMMKAIAKRNDTEPIFNIFETIISGEVVINKDIIITDNRYGFSKISLFADKYSLPASILIEFNPHLDSDRLKKTDTIFIPKTTAIAGKITALSVNKNAEVIYNNCEVLVSEVINNELD